MVIINFSMSFFVFGVIKSGDIMGDGDGDMNYFPNKIILFR